MKLKCIGGKNNGNWWEVSNDYRIHEIVKIFIPEYMPITADFDFTKVTEISQTFDVEYYKIEILRFNKNEWRILILPNMNINDYMIGLFNGLFTL